MDEKKYTLEDIETLRQKTGVGYGEAVRLLEKYDGDITKALIELEKRGELNNGRFFSGKNVDKKAVEGFFKKCWRSGCETRVIVERQNTQLINLSALFMILALVLGWKLVVGGAVLALILGCRVRVHLPDNEKAEEPVKETAEEAETVGASEETVSAASAEAETDKDGYTTVTIE